MKKLLSKPILFGFVVMELFLFIRIITDQLCRFLLPHWLFAFGTCLLEVSLVCIFALWMTKQLGADFLMEFRTDCLKKAALLLAPLYAAMILNIIMLLSAVAHSVENIPGDRVLISLLCAFLAGLRAGISEEMIFRVCILGCMVHQRTKQAQNITASVWLSAVFFGLAHLSNTGNQSVSITLVQTLYCVSTGFLLGAVYVRTRSILLPILIHTIVDFFPFIQAALHPGSVQENFSTAYLLICIGLSLFWFISAGYILRRGASGEIEELWNNRITP